MLRAVTFGLALLTAAACSSKEPASSSGGTGGGAGAFDGGDAGDAAAPATLETFARLSVAQPTGTDELWVAATAPEGSGPLPVVVFARGKGLKDLTNCAPLSGPRDAALARDTRQRAQALARLGYLAVAVAYRNVGDGAPSGDAFKPRDEDVLDARAVLAAAQWARSEHPRGSGRVAFIGTSMGTWPALWAASTRPELAELQGQLDVRSVVLTGESASHLSNAAPDAAALGSTNESERAVGLMGLVLRAVVTAARVARLSEVRDADFQAPGVFRERLEAWLTPRGLALGRALLTRPPPSAAARCAAERAAGTSASCSTDCAGAVLEAALPPGATSLGPSTDWVTSVTLEAFGFYQPPRVDPGAAPANPLLAALRSGSPALAVEGLLTHRALSLLSQEDPHADDAAQQQLIRTLRALGATTPDAPQLTTDTRGACGHEDYHDPARRCGFQLIQAELAEAFRD